MSQAHIQAKIRQYLSNSRQNSSSTLFLDFNHEIRELTGNFPMLPLHQIKAFCKAQEQTIIEKVIPRKPFDLYDEIAKVCPYEKDIRTISADEIALRVNLYNTKLVLHQKMTCQSQSEQWQENKQESFFGEVQFEEGCMISSSNQEHTMRNIFQECDNQQNNWGHHQYFGLN